MAEIRSLSDLSREAKNARERHERLRAARLQEIIGAIERAMRDGADEISSVLQSLSERERKDLFDHFPRFLSSLQSASSLEELMAITRGVSALRSKVAVGSAQTSKDVQLARHALVFAKAPNAPRREIVSELERLDSPPETLVGALSLWLRVHVRVFWRKVRRRKRRT